jgi:hypothetical protein
VLLLLYAAGFAHLRRGLTAVAGIGRGLTAVVGIGRGLIAVVGIGRGRLTDVLGVVSLLLPIFQDNVSALHRYSGSDSTRRSSMMV